jgi:N-acetylmuramoyl-L-alanine amidase
MKFLLDPGHGGLSFGHYLTPGKRSPEIPPGFYEGAYNRRICKLIEIEAQNSIYLHGEVLTIAPGPVNIPLAARWKYVNHLWRIFDRELALISIHCNAIGFGKWRAANGFVVFKPKRPRTQRDNQLAQLVHDHYQGLCLFRDRGIKEANFTMIRRPLCPAVLLEMGFMTNRSDVEKLQQYDVQEDIARAVVGAMAEYSETVV